MRVLGGCVSVWSLWCGLFALSACGGRSIGDGFPSGAGGDGASGGAGSSSVDGANAAGEANDLTTGWPDPPPDPGSEATTFQINSHHDGAQLGDALSLPLTRRWARKFGSAATFVTVSYPLVAAGRVFVTTAGGNSSELLALDEASGATLWGPTELGGSYAQPFAAYALGRVFTLNSDGVMQAFDAASGERIWLTQLPGQYSFSAPPTVYGRRVFVGREVSDGMLYAVAGNNGRVLWAAPIENGNSSSPVVTDSGVYVSYACAQAYGFDPAGGSLLWQHEAGCPGETESANVTTMALLGSSLYARDWGSSSLVLDVRSGKARGTFFSDTIPAGNATTVFTTQKGALVATPLTGVAMPSWTYSGATVSSAPLAVGQTVVVGCSVGDGVDRTGEIDVLDAKSGTLLSSDSLPAPVPAPDVLVASPLTGMAAANNHLFFSAGDSLYAY